MNFIVGLIAGFSIAFNILFMMWGASNKEKIADENAKRIAKHIMDEIRSQLEKEGRIFK